MPAPSESGFDRINTPRAFEQVCTQIRNRLSAEDLKPGNKLPPERELAEHLGVARSVVREALRSLEVAGLVELRKGGTGGAFISTGNARPLTQTYEDMMRLGAISLSDLMEARSLVLVDAIRLACERATSEDLAALDENVALTEKHTLNRDHPSRSMAATDFYGLLARASKNGVLAMSINAMTATLRQFLKLPNGKPLPTLIDSRKRFMKHLRARDAEKATKEMTVYLAGLHQHMITTKRTVVKAAKSEATAK